MTYGEALKEVRHQVYRNTDDFEIRISKECYKTIIEALEKQIPKKPITDRYNDICPNCGRNVHNPLCSQHHCKCGQAIDWRET